MLVPYCPCTLLPSIHIFPPTHFLVQSACDEVEIYGIKVHKGNFLVVIEYKYMLDKGE
jgi:hypothetical protein